jgi:hypothetical protein
MISDCRLAPSSALTLVGRGNSASTGNQPQRPAALFSDLGILRGWNLQTPVTTDERHLLADER